MTSFWYSYCKILNRFHTFFKCFYCWLWTGKCFLERYFWNKSAPKKIRTRNFLAFRCSVSITFLIDGKPLARVPSYTVHVLIHLSGFPVNFVEIFQNNLFREHFRVWPYFSKEFHANTSHLVSKPLSKTLLVFHLLFCPVRIWSIIVTSDQRGWCAFLKKTVFITRPCLFW